VRRAVVATVATAAGLALLLGYKSGGGTKAVNSATGSSPTTTSPSATPGATSPPPTTNGAGTTAYTSQLVSYAFGDIQLTVDIKENGSRSSDRITAVTVPRNDAFGPRSQMIDEESVPVLVQEALAAQGVNIEVVSGATFTSDAFIQALGQVLQEAGK